jgi:hypothetical protein
MLAIKTAIFPKINRGEIIAGNKAIRLLFPELKKK